MTSIPLYKVLTPEGTGGYSNFKWPLPKNGKPGAWVTVKGKLAMCLNGLHATSDYSKWWQYGGRIFRFEYKGEVIHEGDNKMCCRSARLIAEITIDDPMIELDSRLWCYVLIGMKQRGEIEKINLSGADLRGAYLHGAYLRDADLRGADLRGADLRDADLRDADLRGAYLGGAYLGGADLRDADLRDADLGDANLGGAYRPHNPPKGYTPNKGGYLEKE